MPIPCSKPLKANPFKVYRDPQSGRWVTILPPERDYPLPSGYLNYRVQVTDWVPALYPVAAEPSHRHTEVSPNWPFPQ
ncbi:hypothetical protein [Almyronema epifaneia]|uniref:Uncharacterized protein n=1 Tax=Almyronema epifaneia S1 TaxID=2991925 RepID=A0ABW6IAL2_9CYAN